MNTEMRRWVTDTGVAFLRTLGMQPGDTVLDFGASVGYYTLPAARLVGDAGRVYALDQAADALDELRTHARTLGLETIEPLSTDGSISIPLASSCVDLALLFDILHYFDTDDRTALYGELHRVLVPTGRLAVYPKHTVDDDYPFAAFRDRTRDEVLAEIEATGFELEEEHHTTLSHDGELTTGRVYAFLRS